jgi:hypothetical protein
MKVSQTLKCFIQTIFIVKLKVKPTMCLRNLIKLSFRNNQMRLKALENIVDKIGTQLTTYSSHISPNYYCRIKHVEFDVFRKPNKFWFLAMSLHPHC